MHAGARKQLLNEELQAWLVRRFRVLEAQLFEDPNDVMLLWSLSEQHGWWCYGSLTPCFVGMFIFSFSVKEKHSEQIIVCK